MARLMELLCMAGWLMVSLAVIVCTKLQGEDTKEIASIEPADVNKWEQIAEACRKKLDQTQSFRWNKIRPDEAVRCFDELKNSLNHLPDRKAEDLVPQRWINLLALREQTLECNDNSIRSILDQAVARRGDSWQLNYVLNCFQGHLDNCGYENKYKRVIQSIDKQGSFKPTLGSFLEDVVWKHIGDTNFNLDGRLQEILKFFRKIPDIESMSLECSIDFWRKWADLLTKSTIHEQLYELMKGYFALYLKECRFEERFIQVMKNHNVAIDESDSPFASYLWGDFLKNTIVAYHATDILFAIKFLDDLDKLDQKGEFTCTEKTTFDISILKHQVNMSDCTKFNQCVDDIIAKYLKACPDEIVLLNQKLGDKIKIVFRPPASVEIISRTK